MQKKNERSETMVLLSFLLLVIVMVLFVPDDKKGWEAFCGSVAILYAILLNKGNKE